MIVIGNHLRHAGSQFAGEGNVQKLIRPVRVGIWSQHTGDHELIIVARVNPFE